MSHQINYEPMKALGRTLIERGKKATRDSIDAYDAGLKAKRTTVAQQGFGGGGSVPMSRFGSKGACPTCFQ